ncbi:MAG TPA: hypothetical protein VFU32_10055 [Ktedonobacterales bacterium]|nr:hypothetical protein [Ktedonobacterales bacterium]
MPQRFYSDNDTDTPADALKAVGLAEVLRAWLIKLARPDTSVTIKDRGGYYEISLPSAIEMTDIAAITEPFAVGRGKKLVKKPKDKEKAASAAKPLDGFPYDEQQELKATYFAQLKKLSPADRKRYRANPQAEEFAFIGSPPDPDLGLYVCLNHFKVADAYNSLCLQWETQDALTFQANLALVLETFAQHPNATDAAAARWNALVKEGRLSGKGDVTLLQVVNAASGKGGNTPKANGLGIGNLNGFWLTEFLKFVGFFTIAAPLMITNSKDRKTYILHPVNVEVSALWEVMKAFRDTFYRSTAVKLDILAALQFTQRLVQRIEAAINAGRQDDPILALFGGQPTITDIGRGFDIAFYKDMGSAYATMNLASINLPNWLGPITSAQAASAIYRLLDEHRKVIDSIKSAKGEEGSEELELLRRYRDFLSGHDSHLFFEFAALYGDYYLAKRQRKQWASQFTTEGMEQLMAQAKERRTFSPILENVGFREIATAIRRATVIAQYQAARESGYPFEVRYGLGQELLRAAAYPEDFIAALSTFLQSYNAENARIAERVAKGSLSPQARNRRAAVQTEHIKEVVKLVDAYGSDVICKMLVAYGYARDPRIQEEKAPEGTDEGEQDIQETGEDE